MLESAMSLAVTGDRLSIAETSVLICGDPSEADTAARVQFPRAAAEFRAQAVPETIGESCGRVLKNAGRVHELHETRRDVVAFRHYRFRMPRAVPVDVLDRFVDAVPDLD